MQLIGNFYEYYLEKNNKKINIIVATSGDTGAAAIDAIRGKKNINIFVLHPNNKISSVQRKLMTTIEDDNVFNLAINGNFDDCQNLVKSMFSDTGFANTINMSGGKFYKLGKDSCTNCLLFLFILSNRKTEFILFCTNRKFW